jgi:hypothetical protein
MEDAVKRRADTLELVTCRKEQGESSDTVLDCDMHHCHTVLYYDEWDVSHYDTEVH